MFPRILLLTLGLAIAQAQPPSLDASAQQLLIEKMKVAGQAYVEQLKSFSVSQRKVRTAASVDNAAKDKWKSLDVQESDLSFDSGKLRYRLLRVNGDTKNPEKRVKRGYFDAWGEFEAMEWVFNPKREAAFAWDHLEPGGTCVIRYRVPQPTSSVVLTVNLDKAQLGHEGLAFVDCDSGAVSRLQIKSDSGTVKLGRKDIAVGVELDVQYSPTLISGLQFLLPSQAVITGLFNGTWTKAELTFSSYRKYDASSSIVFNEP